MAVTTEPVDWIPDHLPDEVKRQILALTEESGATVTIECSEPLIRHWCEATEDANPLYLDDEFARSQGFRGIVAPPAMNMTLSIPYRWPRSDHLKADGPLHFKLKKLMNLPVGVVVDIETDYLRFVEVGDRLVLSGRLASISARKRTRMGDGYFWVIEGIARNQRGDVVTRSRTTMFACNPDGRPPEDDDVASEGFSRATEEALDAERCTHLPPDRHVHWDDVHEGDTLPTLVMPITVTRSVYLASATRDFSPHHSNRDYAQQRVHARDMFLNTPFNTGMLSRFATEWGGPASRLRRIKLQMRDNICAGDDMHIDGTIARRYTDGDEHLVEIDVQVSTQHGPAYGAKVTIALPTR
jgi:acyl dehydratase